MLLLLFLALGPNDSNADTTTINDGTCETEQDLRIGLGSCPTNSPRCYSWGGCICYSDLPEGNRPVEVEQFTCCPLYYNYMTPL
jgi:hypothetical protein